MGKHILLYTDDPGSGGVAQYNHMLMCGLTKLDYRLTCVQSQSSTPLISCQQELGIKHQWLEFDTTKEVMRSVSDQSQAQKIFESAKPDLIIFSDGWPLASSGAKQVAIRMGISFIVVIGTVTTSQADQFPLVVNELSQFYRRAKAVIAVSTENLNLLRQFYGLPEDKGQVIYSGRPDKYFTPAEQSVRLRLRQELGIPSDAVVCFTSARLEPIKGHQYQLSAIEQLKETDIWDSVYFIWAGGGQLITQMQEAIAQLQIEDKVKILGQRWDIPNFLDTSDIFILTSLVEGMPLAIMEAMAKGLPVIATAVSGVPEELGETGKLLPDPKVDPQGTISELAATIHAWCANSQLRHEIAESCKIRAQKLFKEERMISQIHEVIENALQPNWDYVSPGLELISLGSHFPNLIVGNTGHHSLQPYLRWEVPHNWYVDRRYPTVGFLNHDEAHILYNTAKQFVGKRALEIGCWLGWSACHLAAAGVELDVIEPMLAQSDLAESVSSSLVSAHVLERVNLIGGYTQQKVVELAKAKQCKWPLIFFEGNYQAPVPLYNAILCEKYAEEDAIILFHNLASPDVAQGWEYFRQQGWNVMIYQTMQIMGVAWRGNVKPVMHQPDPQVHWSLPQHLQHYPVSGLSRDLSGTHSFSVVLNQLFSYVQQSSEVEGENQGLFELYWSQQTGKTITELNHQGKHFLETGDCAQAIELFEKVLKINPYSKIAHNYLNRLYWQKGDIHKSIKHHILGNRGNYTPDNGFDEFIKIIAAIKPYTLLSGARLFSLYSLAKQICLDDIPGNFVECGSCKGGSAALLAFVIKRYSIRPRLVYAFDTFTGMPEPTTVDKHRGIPANYTGLGAATFNAPISENLHVVCQTLDVSDIVVPVQGLFAQTLPQTKSEISDIALLHANGDWYESTMDIFNTFYEDVVANGVIQVNNYGFWEGCRKAIHDFERSHGLSFALRAIDDVGVWFDKQDSLSHECNHWHSFWYLAQAAYKIGDLHLAHKATEAVLIVLPRLIMAEHMLECLGKISSHTKHDTIASSVN
jgi:glycosyltransferase involved in cell wall biosynthesis/predicted O-methyltransferase YrrM